jgi:hypothetical protein
MSPRLLRWALFSVIIALLPLVFRFVWDHTQMQVRNPSIASLLDEGELLLISAALAAAAIGELLPQAWRTSPAVSSPPPQTVIISSGCSVITVLFSSLYYAAVSSSSTVKPNVVAIVSVVLFLISLVSSAGCVILSEKLS